MVLVKWLARIVLNLLFQARFSGLEKLDFRKPTILIPNHLSLIDAALLATRLPEEVTFVVNTRIAKKFAPLIRLRKHIAVDPMNPYSVKQMVKTVQKGAPLLVFPEGRVNTASGGSLMKIYSGVGYIALRTGATLYPIALNGPERSKFSYLKHKIRQVWFPKVTVQIGDPFTLDYDRSQSMKSQKERAAAQIQKKLEAELVSSRVKTGINLFNELLTAAKHHGYKFPVCEDISQTFTYKKLLSASYVFARKLAAELKDEPGVAVLLPNSAAHLLVLFALFKLDKRPAILNFSAGENNMRIACETASVRTILTSRQFVDKGKLTPVIESLGQQYRVLYLEDMKDTLRMSDKLSGFADFLLKRKATVNNTEIVLFTSGSESVPKGVVLDHANLYANMQQTRTVMDINARDVFFNAMPMFHSLGLLVTVLPVLNGVKVFLYPSPLHYKIIPELAYDRNATFLFGTSTFLAAYGKAAHPYDFQSLRCVIAGAEKLKDEVRQLWVDKFHVCPVEGYGTTEASPVVAMNTRMWHRKGTVGQLLPGIAYKLEPVPGLEGGKLLIQGPNLMKGYLLHEKGFIPCPEWYDTGDVVKIDEDGFVTIVSRVKRFAKIGGEMVSLNQVEELAASCYRDANVAAVSVPDSRKGERIILFVTQEEHQIQTIKQFVKDHGHSQLMTPSKLVQVEKLPILGSGKPDYVALKKLAEEPAADEGANAV
ncbi:AMP-binding protein [Paenibacillus oleatilyticus]|uniref:AMP-binding protein n=1 Tax=Paenibacillus oleatilyticus TaxID=2594886 RepID=A0ABV4UV61_9BACL